MNCSSVTSYDECYTPAVWNYLNITRPFSIIYYVLGGSAFYTIEGVEYPFLKDHLYIFPANKLFSLREDPCDKFYSVYIHAFTSPEISSLVTVDTRNEPFITEALSFIRKYAKEDDSVYIRHLTDMLLSYIFDVLVKSDDTLAKKIRSYIDINFIRAFKVNDLSAHFNYSSSYISKLFKQNYNLTPKQYARQLILKESVTLLDRRASVSEVAERLEFSYSENFCRFFKGYYGYSPSQYVKKFKNFPT